MCSYKRGTQARFGKGGFRLVLNDEQGSSGHRRRCMYQAEGQEACRSGSKRPNGLGGMGRVHLDSWEAGKGIGCPVQWWITPVDSEL